jgi:integrase
MRRGEMLGLGRSEVDFARSRISIVRALVRGRDVVPKSKRARDVEMTPPLRDVLERLASSRAGRDGIGSTASDRLGGSKRNKW